VSRDTKGNPVTLVVNGEGKVEQRQLVLDREIGNDWLVATGIKPGDKVIAEGLQQVRPGVAVSVVPFDGGKPGPENAAQPAQASK